MQKYKRLLLEDYSTNFYIGVYKYLENKIEESLFEIEKDVNLIYNIIFQKNINNFIKKNIELPDSKYDQLFSKDLKTLDCKKAHDLKPIIIEGGVFNSGSFYDSKNNRIQISLDTTAYRKSKDLNSLSKKDKKKILYSLSKDRIKLSIAHELSHWISDVLHNNYLYNLISKAYKISKDSKYATDVFKKIISLGKGNVNTTHYEIDAQVHAIKQLYNIRKEDWSLFTLSDIFELYPPLKNIGLSLYYTNPNLYKDWIKDLIKRLNRESLLGKNMNSIPDIKQIEESLIVSYI